MATNGVDRSPIDISELRELLSPPFSEDELALRFSAEHGDDYRYVARWGKWMRWTGTCWQLDDVLHVFDLARMICRAATAELDPEKTGESKRITAASTVAAVERLARCDRRHAATVEQWDAEPWLLNTPGGVVDLRTGELRPHRRGDYFTKLTAVPPAGECPRWIAFLERVTDGNRDLQLFLQRMTGYTLTGSTRDEALFFLWGSGANGKSKFLGAISGMLGDYAKTAPMETFMATKGEHHPTDLASLQGARLVTAIETESGRNWAESKIKNLTGGDRIAARFMRQDYFEFTPQFKLVIAGNHKPSLRCVDEAIRRRFYLLPFVVTIPEAERDFTLGEKLRGEWGGILRWAIEGCLEWQNRGLDAPVIVRAATAEYMCDEDTFGQWIEERCVIGKRCMGQSSVLYQDYCKWCEQVNEKSFSCKKFSLELQRRGYVGEHTMVGRVFSGIGLREEVHDGL